MILCGIDWRDKSVGRRDVVDYIKGKRLVINRHEEGA